MVCVPFLGSIANFEALMTMTLSPTIAFGVNSGLSLPRRVLAMTTASRPTLWSVASIKIQRRVTVSGLKNVVFIHILLVNSLLDYHKPAISQRLEAANDVNPYARRGFGQMATCPAQQLSSVIDGNQVEAASRHHLPRIRDVGSGKRIGPRFDTDPPLPGLEDEVRHAAYHLSLIHISEPTRLGMISYAVFCLK